MNHPCSSESWIEYETAHSLALQGGSKLLLVHVFLDEYRSKKGAKTLHNACVISVTNVSEKVCIHLSVIFSYLKNLFSRQLKFLLANIDPHIPLQDFLDKALIPFILKLEEGLFSAYFYPTQRIETFVGGLHALLGFVLSSLLFLLTFSDHPGQADLACLPSALCMAGTDRYLTIAKDDISKDVTDAQLASLRRDPIKAYAAISEALRKKNILSKTEYNKILSNELLSGVVCSYLLRYLLPDLR